jgi:glycine/serine hydroxymethyltransferase
MQDIKKDIDEHIKNSLDGLYLHASECIVPPSVQLAHLTHLTYRYSHTKRDNLNLGDTAFSNALQFNQLRDELQKEFSTLLKANWVSLNNLSGMNAVTSMIQAIVKKDDVVFIVSPLHGGHPSVKGIINSCEATTEWIPFLENMMIDWQQLEEKVHELNPKLILLNISDSLLVNHLPDRKINLGQTLLCVDISHYLSMYILNKTDELFEKGADILLGSTHKSFPGPHKGFIALKDSKLIEHMQEQLSYYVSSDHSHHLLALWVSLKEFEYFGKKFIEQSQKNLNALGEGLLKNGLNPIKANNNFGDTHQLWVKFKDEETAKKSFLKLEEIGLYVNYKLLAFNLGWGFRIGIQEVTILGFKEDDMYEIASIISDCLKDINSVDESLNRVEKLIQKINPLWEKNSDLYMWLQKLNGLSI